MSESTTLRQENDRRNWRRARTGLAVILAALPTYALGAVTVAMASRNGLSSIWFSTGGGPTANDGYFLVLMMVGLVLLLAVPILQITGHLLCCLALPSKFGARRLAITCLGLTVVNLFLSGLDTLAKFPTGTFPQWLSHITDLRSYGLQLLLQSVEPIFFLLFLRAISTWLDHRVLRGLTLGGLAILVVSIAGQVLGFGFLVGAILFRATDFGSRIVVLPWLLVAITQHLHPLAPGQAPADACVAPLPPG